MKPLMLKERVPQILKDPVGGGKEAKRKEGKDEKKRKPCMVAMEEKNGEVSSEVSERKGGDLGGLNYEVRVAKNVDSIGLKLDQCDSHIPVHTLMASSLFLVIIWLIVINYILS